MAKVLAWNCDGCHRDFTYDEPLIEVTRCVGQCFEDEVEHIATICTSCWEYIRNKRKFLRE